MECPLFLVDRKTLADGVQRNQLQPGDLIVLGHANVNGGAHEFGHTVVYVGEKNQGAIDGTENIIMANWARGNTDHFRVMRVKLGDVLGAAPLPYDKFSVVRLKMPN